MSQADMRVLAIDTALANCAAAVLDNGAETACFEACSEEIGRGHAEVLMDMIGEVMAETSTAFSDLDRVAVTVGPGSFTGLRVGLAVARGFGLVLGKPVVGITTLAAIARSNAPADNGAPLLVALTGKGNEVYCQEFTSSGDKSGEAAVRTLDDLAATLPRSIRLAGSAAEKIAQALDLPQDQIISRMEFAAIREVAELGLVADPVVSTPSPLYLRPPDATPQTRGRIERQ
ncbi:tRNA threonylcarbamoyladenosine biosynthesis protein TsaB [Labrenzia sp. EL_126]|nr:tRNA threonylcarbamoyladenosine biosynthesis protein TsaB [Labrenzia sp. EL_126]